MGDYIWFFDLESSEDLEQHGAKSQPHNFHQNPPGPRWTLARSLRVFRVGHQGRLLLASTCSDGDKTAGYGNTDAEFGIAFMCLELQLGSLGLS